MEERKKRGLKREQGSAIIETVLCLTIFMVAIFTILSFINLCRAQAMISSAVDAAAKEMSQYAYFYHLSGLDSLEKSLVEETGEARESLNNIIGATESLYATLNCRDDASATEEKLAAQIDSVLSGASSTAGIEDSIKASAAGTSASLVSDIGKLTTTLSSIDDPMGFFKSIVTIAGLEGASMVKSRLIAAPLAKILVKKHFELNGMDADSYLRSFRIDGMDALNFNMSTLFAPTSPEDIHLVVYYQMHVVNFFNFEFGDITLCKEAVTRAWLGGDEDIRPKSVTTGVWDMGSLKYGKYITAAEVEDLEKRGCYKAAETGIDAFDPASNTWISIRSMDIYSKSYLEDAAAVKNALRKEYSKLVSSAGGVGDTIGIKADGGDRTELSSPGDSRRTKLVLVIPEGASTEAFRKGLEDFQKELGDGSFTIEVKEGYGSSPKTT